MIWIYIGLAVAIGVAIGLAVALAGSESNERPGYIDLTGGYRLPVVLDERMPVGHVELRETDACGCVSGGRHVCGQAGFAVGPSMRKLRS